MIQLILAVGIVIFLQVYLIILIFVLRMLVEIWA